LQSEPDTSTNPAKITPLTDLIDQMENKTVFGMTMEEMAKIAEEVHQAQIEPLAPGDRRINQETPQEAPGKTVAASDKSLSPAEKIAQMRLKRGK